MKEDKPEITDIRKPKSNNQEFVYKELKNGLKVLLISDKEADVSAASMAVGVGSLSSKREYEGIPHFCEHMLFMGTKKYPDENEFEEYLQNNSGSSNAYTDIDSTVYYFDVSNEAFPEALDRFGHFFIDPIFKQDTVERELKAVDSEHQRNINTDTWRLRQLILSESKEGSAFKMFGTGSKETLNKPEIRDVLLEFFYKYYTPHNMGICVISNRSLQELRELVYPIFEQIPENDNYEIPTFKYDIAYDSSNMNYFYKIVPIKDEDKISIKWFLDNQKNNYKEIPSYFCSNILGHEGPNSLTASLKRDNLISSLLAGGDDKADCFHIFTITVTLTKRGKDNWKEVILRILKYVKILQDKKQMDRRLFLTHDECGE